jgi:hypothetical protein
MKRSINRSFKRGAQAKCYDEGSTIYYSMNNNAAFAAEQPLIDVLKVKREAYDVAKAAAATRDSLKVGIKNDCFADFTDQLDRIADVIEMRADGDVRIVQNAGFVALTTASRTISDFLEVPDNFKVTNEDRLGVVKASWKRDPDAINYGLEWMEVKEAATWQNGTYSTSSTALLTGLPSGKYVMVRLYSIGRKGRKSDPTEPITVLVS